MRIVADLELCEGNARCMKVAPELFRVDDNDQVVVLVERPSEAQRQAAEAAVAVCPRQALKLVSD